MAFITQTDFTAIMRSNFLDAILKNDASAFDAAVSNAVGQMKMHLHEKYDTTTIFSQTGTNRDAVLLQWGIYITRYLLEDRTKMGGGSQMQSKAEKDYDDTMKKLDQVRKGELCLDLPTRISTETGRPYTNTRYGYEDRRTQL